MFPIFVVLKLKEGIEFFRSRVLLKALDAILTESLRPKQSVGAHVRGMLSSRTPHYDRVAAVIALVAALSPAMAARFTRSIYRTDKLPFASRSAKLLDFGSGATVLLLETDSGPKVLKVLRRSLGRSSQSLVSFAKEFQAKYDAITSWYNGRFELVAPVHFVALHGPVLGAPAVAGVQEYVGGEKKDFFRDFEDRELVGLLARNPELRRQFLDFVEVTIRLRDDRGLFVDFLGKNNLLLVVNQNFLRLLVLENGIFDLKEMRRRSSATHARIEQRIARMRALLERLNIGEGTPASPAVHGALPGMKRS